LSLILICLYQATSQAHNATLYDGRSMRVCSQGMCFEPYFDEILSVRPNRVDKKLLFNVYTSFFVFTEATDSTGFAAVKLTALGRPQLLVLF